MKRTDAMPARPPHPAPPHERVTRAVRLGFRTAQRGRIAPPVDDPGRGSETPLRDTVQAQSVTRVLDRYRNRAAKENK